MVIDVHVHICPREVRDNREKYLPGEPEFSSIYDDPKAKLIGAGELIQAMDSQGVDKAVVFGFPWRKTENFRLNNDYVLEAMDRFPDRLIGLCCLDATHPQADQEVKRCFESGIKGVGELGFYVSGIDQEAIKALKKITDLCQEADLPILMHTNEPVGHQYPGKSPMNLQQLYNLLKTYPKVKWILAHLGGGIPFYAFLKKEVRQVLENCWFDTAAMPFLYRPEAIRAMIQAVGLEKILYGSDFPLLPPSRYYQELDKTDLTSEEKEAVFGQNAQKLLNLDI